MYIITGSTGLIGFSLGIYMLSHASLGKPRPPRMSKSALPANLACPKIPGMCIFWKQKAPAGWLLTQRRV